MFFRFFLFFCFLYFLFLKTCFSSDSIIHDMNDIDNNIKFFLVKKEFNKKNYRVTRYYVKSILFTNKIGNKYSIKSSLYLLLIKSNLNKIFNGSRYSNLLVYNTFFFKKKYLDYLSFTRAKFFYHLDDTFFNINKYKRDQKSVKDALANLRSITNSEKNKFYLDSVINLIRKECKNKKVYITDYYLKKRKAFIAALRRARFNYQCIDKYDRYRNYVTIRCFNELFVSNISDMYLDYKRSGKEQKISAFSKRKRAKKIMSAKFGEKKITRRMRLFNNLNIPGSKNSFYDY